eukprot:Polyplicarium_translucidae@DN2443_c0_g1_i3.p4
MRFLPVGSKKFGLFVWLRRVCEDFVMGHSGRRDFAERHPTWTALAFVAAFSAAAFLVTVLVERLIVTFFGESRMHKASKLMAERDKIHSDKARCELPPEAPNAPTANSERPLARKRKGRK